MAIEKIELINPLNLRIARENVGLTTREATDQICGRPNTDKVKEWEDGKDYPTIKQWEKMSQMYGVNRYSLTDDSPLSKNRKILFYRSRVNGNSQEKRNINCGKYINFLLQRQQYLENVIKEADALPNQIAGSLLGKRMKPKEAADYIAKTLDYQPQKFGNKPRAHLKYLISRLEANAVFVMKTMSYWHIPREYMQGMYLHSKYAPIIAINRRDAPADQLFTLAYEVARLFKASEGIADINFFDDPEDADERFFNEVATLLLLPDHLIERKVYEYEEIRKLASDYQVSQAFVFYRLKNKGFINKRDMKYIEKEINKSTSQEHKKRGTGGDYTATMKDSNGRLYNELVASQYFSGRISPVAAMKLLKFSIEYL